MDFARKQLEKYGWEEGKGLGKHENGITKPVKPSLKFDNGGIGHQIGKEFVNNWWDKVYNQASNNVKVKKTKDDIQMDLVSGQSIEITTKGYSVKDFKRKNHHLEYGTFLKTAKLSEGGEVNYTDVVTPEETGLYALSTIPDDVLFAACEGRTAHKGARHGVKMSGKLSRIEKQEKMLMKKLQKVSLSDDENSKASKKLKKLSKQIKPEEKEESTSQDASGKKKKRKKKRKSVSFNETVTEYHTQELDTSSQSNESGDPLIVLASIINDRDRFEDLNLQDEGIEQDCDMKSEDFGQQSFEEVQKSKKEKKKKKKPEEVEVEPDLDQDDDDPPIVKEKKSRATEKFLEAVFDEDSIDKYKRKHDEDDLLKNFKKHCDGVNSKCLKKKKKKKRPHEKITISSIVASLDKVCKISDTE